jgi:ATP-binding cassette subfamily B protein
MSTDNRSFEEKTLGKTYDARLLRRLYVFSRPFTRPIIWSVFLVMAITVLDLCIPYATKIAIDRYITPSGMDGMRVTEADMRVASARAVVEEHPDLFIIQGSRALIAADKLGRLTSSEIAVLRARDIKGLGLVAVLFLAIIALNFVFNFFQKWIMVYTGHMIMHDLRMHLFRHIQSLSMEFFTRNPVGRLVTRVTNDVQNMDELFTSVIAFVFKDLFLLVGITAVLIALDWKLALATFTVLPLVGLATIIFSARARDIFRLLRVKIAEINTRFSETIGGMKVIQLFHNEADNYRAFKTLNHENYLAGMRQIRVLGLFLPTVEVLGVMATAVVIYVGGGAVLTESLTLGTLVAFIAYIKMFFRPIRDLAEKYTVLQDAMASAERIFLILDSKSRLIAPRSSAVTAHRLESIETISLDDVSFSYLPGEPVLRDINLIITAGEVLGVVGPTGSGKTTLINLITRFYDPNNGRVLINGIDAREYEPQAYRSKMALVMQDPFLFSETIRDNVFRSDGKMTTAEMDTILEVSNCRILTDKLPYGADTVLSEGGASISSGERQLISIARAFAREPELILFDEATSYIDTQTELKIQEALEVLMRNRTSIIVAHRLSTVRHADRIIVLNRGRIVETGSHEKLMAVKGFYYRLRQFQD